MTCTGAIRVWLMSESAGGTGRKRPMRRFTKGQLLLVVFCAPLELHTLMREERPSSMAPFHLKVLRGLGFAGGWS